MRNNFSSNIEDDISIILSPLKSSFELEKELSIDQLTTYLNINKVYIDEIIEGIAKFFTEENSIDEFYFFKTINTFCEKLEQNNLPQISYINKIFPVLMDKIYNFKFRQIKDENTLFNTLSFFTRKLGNNIGEIEYHLNIIFDKLSKDDSEFDLNDKFILISALKIFLKNSPNASFNKIIKYPQEFKKIIHNFKHKNKMIRKAVQQLVEEFLIILFNKEDAVRIEQSEKMIYDVCFKDYFDIPNISEFTKHGVILVLNSFAVQNPKNENQINEFFKEKYEIFLNYLYSNLTTDNNVIKIAIIRTLSRYCQIFPYLMEKSEQEKNISKILNHMIILCDESEVNEKINSEILKAFGNLSLIPQYESIISENLNSIFDLILREISGCKILNDSILNCLSNIMTNYGNKFAEIFNFEFYYEKLFSYGLKDSHLNFLKKLLKLYPKYSKDNFQIIICLLNVISFMITQKEFTFKFSQKKLSVISKEIRDESKFEIKLNSMSEEYPKINLSISKTISAPLNDRFKSSSLQKYNKVGKVIKEYMKDKKEKGIKITNEINNAITTLGYINNDYFEKDILNFYIDNCLNIYKGKELDTKKCIISLGNSSWIPKIDIKKIINMDEIYNLKYIFKTFFECLLVEMNVEIKLFILNIFEDKRYLQFLMKDNFFQKFVSLLEYDSNEIRKRTVEIVGKLIPYDFNTIHSYIKKKLRKIYKYLETSDNQYKQEKNLILLSYFIKYTSKCIEDSLETIFLNLLKVLKKETNNDNNIVDKIKNENNFLIIDILLVISEIMNNPDYNKTPLEIYLSDVMSICIKILSENISFSTVNEESALNTILSILTNSNKDWKIYSDYIDLVYLVIDVISKSQNKQSRLYAMEILGHMGTMNPYKLEILLDLNEFQSENDLDKFLMVDEVNNYSDTEIVYQKNKLMKKAKKINNKKEIGRAHV